MTEADKEIDQLIATHEGQVLEFKKSDILADPIHLAKEMTALTNTMGGVILIGVLDDETYEGLKYDKGHETHIMNIARDRCDPPISPTFRMVSTTKGDVYEIKLSRYKAYPHAVKTTAGKVYFIRVGTTVREASAMELALLFEASKEEVTKKPDLHLRLIDNSGKTVDTLLVKPIFTTIKKVKIPRANNQMLASFEAIKNMSLAMNSFTAKKPSLDLTPVRIIISNDGQAPAQEITVFLRFPEGCEILNRTEVVGGLDVVVGSKFKPTHGGLYLNGDGDVVAWMDGLGNDLTMSNLKEIYVRFPPEEKEHIVSARVVQNYYPPKDFEFKIKVSPEFREVTEEVYEDDGVPETEK